MSVDPIVKEKNRNRGWGCWIHLNNNNITLSKTGKYTTTSGYPGLSVGMSQTGALEVDDSENEVSASVLPAAGRQNIHTARMSF